MVKIQFNFRNLAIVILLLIAIMLPIFIGNQSYIMHILIVVLIFASLAQSWNMLAGFAGQPSLGHNVFFGIGAYTLGLLVYYIDFFKANPWIALILGGFVSAFLIGLPIGTICFRLRGIYFAFATLVSSEIIRIIILNSEFTLAGLGVIIPVPPPIQFGDFVINFRSKIPYYYIVLALTFIIFISTHLIVKSHIGFKLLTIREDEDAALSIGVNSFKAKLFAMLVSSFFAGIAGALYASYMSYIDPSPDPGGVLSTATGLDVIIVGILGGIGTVVGPLIGALIRYPLGEYLRVTFGFTAGLDLMIFGIILVVIIILFPGGVWKFISEKILKAGESFAS